MECDFCKTALPATSFSHRKYCASCAYNRPWRARQPKPKPNRICLECSGVFQSHQEAQYCSNKCRSEARKPKCKRCGVRCSRDVEYCKTCDTQKRQSKSLLRPKDHNCVNCHKWFRMRSGGNSEGRFCSYKCVYEFKTWKDQVLLVVKNTPPPIRICPTCDGEFIDNARSRPACCNTCCRPIWAAQWNQRNPLQWVTCKYCNCLYERYGPTVRPVCKECTQKGTPSRVAAALNKAIRRGCYERGDRIDPKEVYLKQNYRCSICREQTTLTLDHIIPISKGGQHRHWNVRGLCSSCNTMKSNHLKYSSIMLKPLTKMNHDKGMNRLQPR